ncbi:MAG: hypothetical protein L0Z50_37265, partial [Verrucomicrobiales bacterium]|nr:hypothetical protein [Verrucomicrobiales bacterium]
PDKLPILKAGETLTFAGGEFKADSADSEQPGLPGVVGWAVGEVVYDSANPTMNNQSAFDNCTGRLIAPLETILINLSDTSAQTLEALIEPKTGLTSVFGTEWRFVKLASSLQKRVFYDPIKNLLGIRGYLNDKTLGDATLTASPPPAYVLEPDILTRREKEVLRNLFPTTSAWTDAVEDLYALSRNPQRISKVGAPSSSLSPGGIDPSYYVGLELDLNQVNGGDELDASGNPVTIANSARPKAAFGPGLALVPSPKFLEPNSDPNRVGYLTLVENDDPAIGGPITLHIVKVEKKHRYRGAIKTILSNNVFDEKITLRHTGDFGANGDDIVYQWFYREENGQSAPLPPDSAWKIFTDQSNNSTKGLGMYQITLEGSGGLLLADNLLFVRYRHKDDVPADGNNSVDWNGTEWNRDGASFRDPLQRDANGNADPANPIRFGGQWAGAANSPTVELEYRGQLASGWIKRVLDRVNPYEARINDFRNNDSPAAYSSIIRQVGPRFVGPVALNPDKNVIENVGLIELYQTILERGMDLSIDLSSPITTPGINTALLLAATRISDFHMLLANEAYSDALDPLIGFGKHLEEFTEFGSLMPTIFTFQNQVPSLLEEELALLRGIDHDRTRPMHNRLFWNFTKGEGEAAYAMNYHLTDANADGFIDESDGMLLFPQGHGDAWGHYLTAIKARYRLLKHPFFNWTSRSEFYNLLDVVLPVDFLDERKFAEAAAARAQTGAEIVNLTYRSRYVEDPNGQWAGLYRQ